MQRWRKRSNNLSEMSLKKNIKYSSCHKVEPPTLKSHSLFFLLLFLSPKETNLENEGQKRNLCQFTPCWYGKLGSRVWVTTAEIHPTLALGKCQGRVVLND